MNLGEATAIFKDINREDKKAIEKIEAITTVLDMETDNSIHKRDYKAVAKWLLTALRKTAR